MTKWRLGLDMGTNSLGWTALELNNANEPIGFLDAGVRIFSDGRDPKSGASLAVKRREARAASRRRDRTLRRKTALIDYLRRFALWPTDLEAAKKLEQLDPFSLRATALDQALEPHHLGRALFHLNQRRGFKSNRKTDRSDDKEAGKIATGVARLEDAIKAANCRTYGEFLHQRRNSTTDANHIPSVRSRLRPETGEGAKGDGYDFYPGRALLEAEFDAIWSGQKRFHPDLLSEEARVSVREILFHQRPLKAPVVGLCTLLQDSERLAKAHPLFQQRRLLEELNALRIRMPGEPDKPLTLEQRDTLLLALSAVGKKTYASLRTLLKLPRGAEFNKESDNRPHMLGNEVAAALGHKDRLGAKWKRLPLADQIRLIDALRQQEDHKTLVTWLMDTFDLTQDEAEATSRAPLPDGHGRFGLKATEALITALSNEVIVYSDAVVVAGLGHHSDFRTGEVFDRLPYYGVILDRHVPPGSGDPDEPDEAKRYGRITNPTVHVALGQLRRLINSLIDRYGRPSQIVIELARDLKMSEKQKKELARTHKKNREAAEARSSKLHEIGERNTGANRARLKLWEELNSDNPLDRCCVYTGERITLDMVFSSAVDIDHILPFRRTLDDSQANKLLCMREANRQKRDMSPAEKWGHTAFWPDILERASRLPKNKRWRFGPDAMDQFEQQGGFLARQLTDTQYLSRMAHSYLSALYPETGPGSSPAWVIPGRLTEIIRRKLGLNDLLPDHNLAAGAHQAKNRLDHRHHTIDAAVVAVTDRSLLNRMSTASHKSGDDGIERILVPEPWPGFRQDLGDALNNVTVSHRPDHGSLGKRTGHAGSTAGQLHNDTAYGLTGQKNAAGTPIVVHRVPLSNFKKPVDFEAVADETLRAALYSFTDGLEGKPFEAMLARFPVDGPAVFRGIRRVRIHEALKVIEIRDKSGKAYKGYKGDSNYRYDVWELPDGSWSAEVVSMYRAHQKDHRSAMRQKHPTARKVLSLMKDDMIRMERDGEETLFRVVKYAQSGAMVLADPTATGNLKARAADKGDPFRYVNVSPSSLKTGRARQVRVDVKGQIHDPGFPARTARRRTRNKTGNKAGSTTGPATLGARD